MKKRLIVLLGLFLFGALLVETFGQIQRMESLAGSKDEGIRGILQDSTGLPIAYAYLFLIQGKDTTGLVSDAEGRFSYVGKLSDTIRLAVSVLGYKKVEENYIPKKHGFHIRILLQEEVFSLDETIVHAQKRKDWMFKVINLPMIDDRDTLISGICRCDIHPRFLTYAYDSSIPRSFFETPYREDYQEHISKLEQKIIELQARKVSGTSDGEFQIEAIRKHITELESLPDRELEPQVRAKGQTVSAYRKEIIQNLETVMKHLKKVNSQTYIDEVLQESIKRLNKMRAKQAAALRPEVVAEKYKYKRLRASKLTVDGKLHGYRNFFEYGYFIRGLCAVARLKYHPKRKKEVELCGCVDYDGKVAIPFQYGWILNKSFRQYIQEKLPDPQGGRLAFEPADNVVRNHYLYPDSLGWLTVGDFMDSDLMGMIDRENNIMIPLKFHWAYNRHIRIEYFKTSDGEFAPVTVREDGKLLDAIIDRQGNFSLKPTYETPIFFDKGCLCFYTDLRKGSEKMRFYFDAYGKEIRK